MKSTTNMRHLVAVMVLAGCAGLAVIPQVAMASTEWQPISSEKLIRLPAHYMDKSLQQDFRESPLSEKIHALQAQISMEAQRVKELRDASVAAEANTKVEIQHQLLVSKANYLDMMQDKLNLDRQALDTRAQVYERVMNKLRKDKRRAQDPMTADLLARQNAARQRMQQSLITVDQMLTPVTGADDSQYQRQYAVNLEKIEALKATINSHAANKAPTIDGEEVTREDYIRHMLASTETERVVMDQEMLMLTYMAKLVALDAQTLEHTLMYGEGDDVGLGMKHDPLSAASAADWFIE
jgi:transcription initiation factor TFIIIB Brf1 subunit/transcription initiation factor TFIIB